MKHINPEKLTIVFQREDGSQMETDIFNLIEVGVPIDEESGDDLEFVKVVLSED